jgi:hypothetical protein
MAFAGWIPNVWTTNIRLFAATLVRIFKGLANFDPEEVRLLPPQPASQFLTHMGLGRAQMPRFYR